MILITDHCSPIVSIPASYLGYPAFKSWHVFILFICGLFHDVMSSDSIAVIVGWLMKNELERM
jgi:hypothetical protein